MRLGLLVGFLMAYVSAIGQQTSNMFGKITDAEGNALPYVSITISESAVQTISNEEGNYSLTLPHGTYRVVFSCLGYGALDKSLTVGKGGLEFNVEMVKTSVKLESAEVVADSRERAREIMKLVREKRKGYLNALQRFKTNAYQFTKLERKRLPTDYSDTSFYYGHNDQILEISEMISTVYFERPNNYKEVISGIKKSDETVLRQEVSQNLSIGASFDYGEEDITPEHEEETNPWILIEGAQIFDLNLYQSIIDFQAITDKPILSPLAAASAMSYKFDFKGSELVDGKKTCQIYITPLNNLENLFKGDIWFSEEDYSIVKYDLELSGGNLLYAKSFRLQALYEMVDQEVPVLQNSELFYVIRNGKSNIEGTVLTELSDYEVNSNFSDVKFNREIKTFDLKALEQDEAFWESKRGLDLDSSSLKFIAKSTEISEYYESPEYLAKLDSAFNKVNIWTPLIGYGRRNRVKGSEFYVEGILGQINPFGIGGYRHMLPGYIQKEFKNDFKLRTEGVIDYGFGNNDIKGRLNIGFTYNPKKFLRTNVTIGDSYTMVNNFASLEQTFSRSNYIRAKVLGISQRMEVINGLYAQLSFEYQDQQPLDNLEFSDWSEELFGELNTPIDFKRYTKSELNLSLVYRIRQKYYIKGNKKVTLPSKFPELRFRYRKGIKGLFNSEVDFDYLELSGSQEIEVGRFGSTRWQASIGSFVNQRDLRVLEYRFFRGSDEFVFSDPLQSFQLLGPTLSTPNEYIRANVIHHFEGTILNKVPFIRRLKMGLAAGGGTINIPDAGFYHGEVFLGVEKALRIKKELFRLGVYAVTADNTVEDYKLTWKFGLTMYEPFTRKWGY